MAITNGNDTAKSKHLDALAAAAKRYVLEEILDVSEAVAAELQTINDSLNTALGGTVLSTTPATVDGGIWYETTSTAPIVKIYSGGSKYFLYTNQLVSPNLSLSSAAETVSSGSSQTVTLTYSGEGSITLSNPNETALTATYNASTKTITLTNNLSSGDDPADVNVGISLTESGTYAADTKTLAVNCVAPLRDPQLTITPSSIETGGNETVTATVSYLGNGTVTVEGGQLYVYGGGTPYGECSYDSGTKTLSIVYGNVKRMDYTDVFTVSLSASGAYDAATATLIVGPAF